MSRLPSECIQEILKYVDSNLFSCLLVNRDWCRNVVPFIWRDPFRYVKLYHETHSKFLNNYFKSLNREERNWLIQEGIQFSIFTKEQPLIFDYASFLEVMKFDKLDIVIRNWI